MPRKVSAVDQSYLCETEYVQTVGTANTAVKGVKSLFPSSMVESNRVRGFWGTPICTNDYCSDAKRK